MIFSTILYTLIIILCASAISNAKTRPNIIIILTDDQDVTLKGLKPMKNTLQLIANQGATFTNAFTSSPICCPSRASLLSGQYAHNHQTRNNSESGGCYGNFWKENVEDRTIATFLSKNGYKTFFAGKYLNDYYSSKIPPGWSDWYGLHGNSKYYNFTINENGFKKHYDDTYLTDLIKNYTLNFLNQQKADQPFFALVSPPAPHSPFIPATRHEKKFEDVVALRTPNFNLPAGILDKHWLLTMPPAELPDKIIKGLDNIYKKRWQSLLAVDELVDEIISKLKDLNIEKDTYIIYTSDNGYHLGQFAQAYDKRQPYDTDIRVPFLVKGPNINPKSIIVDPILLIDIAPTVYEWAGIPVPPYMDGKSFNNIFESNDIIQKSVENVEMFKERQLLIEYWGEGNSDTYNPECQWSKNQKLQGCTIDAACHCQDAWNNTYNCVRHLAFDIDLIYCEFKDRENFVEAYDLNEDKYQITNLGYELLPSERAKYSLAIANLSACIGKNCRKIY